MAEIEVHLQNGHAEMPFRESKSVCNCCPYGYHIDLDFVRFCEKLAKAGGEPSLSKRLRRERRRQRQSMEVLLGLTNPVLWDIEQLLPTITQETSTPTEATIPPPVKYSSLCRSNDGLNKAVLDFEATLERTSQKKKQKIDEFDSVMRPRPMDFNGQILTREESPVCRRSQDMSPFAEFDSLSMYSSGGGTSPGPLQNIREQMAISLKRMKELEEKVKIIPSLEVEVNSLKSEKTELTEKIEKLKTTLRFTEHHLHELKEEKKDKPKQDQPETKPLLRDVGVGCKILTRDVGVTPILLKNRTVSTETVTEIWPMNGFSVAEIKKPESKSIKSQIQPDIMTRSTITDLYMKDITSILENKAKKLGLKDLEAITVLPRSLDRFHKGIQVTVKEPLTVLKVIEKREYGVQVEPLHKQTRDTGLTAKPKAFDASCDVRPKTREYGSSDDRVTDLFCDKCKNLKTRSVGVGLGNVKLEEKQKTTSLLNRSKSFQLTESSKPKITTRSVAVGTVVPVKKLTSTKGVGTQDHSLFMTKNTGVNTMQTKLIDTGVGTAKISDMPVCEKCKNEAKPPVKPSIPHKESEGYSKDSQPSKIPRPKSNQTTPVMERKKFMRQDTYTKISAQSPFSVASKAKPKVKSIPEKLSSPLEEKVEVTLRKKTKTSLVQSPNTTEKSLSKAVTKGETSWISLSTWMSRSNFFTPSNSQDLKDIHLSNNTDRYSGHFDDYYFDYDENYDDDSKRNSALFPDNALFQPIQDEPREKIKPSKEMKAAMKVVNDSLSKYPNGLPKQLKNASNIIQQEWFKVSSTASANPLDVEDYLDSFEEVSSTLLEYIVNMVDNNGNTAMHYAVSHGNFDVVSILLDSKVCNINKMNAAGYTCIMLVSLAQVRSETHRQVVKRLFQLADVNIRAKQHGQTALMLAVSHGRLDMVKLLLEAGADPNIQDGDGSTALMCAAEHGHLEIVKHILAHPECDTSIVDCDGSTALAIAMEAGNRDIGVLLYAREHFSSSRGSSPYTSLRGRKSKSSSSPHPRTPTSPNPNRKSDPPA